ncbi:GntR family transcriptional regulator [Stutzerimonas azotifigens]|uniref:GntR family transcriptional regulator n=1 Tax=Stutzerimonas azotifigens TaxID=291995 RepID=UPI0004215CAD|nr:GntR family transcriptional regulator [Stutzerimonas azotifigens]
MSQKSSTGVGSDTDPWPKHHRVYLVLRQQIKEGLYGDGQALPTELLLAEQFQVSRITIRKAMDRLEREGLVVRLRGKGTFARSVEEASPVQASICGVIENLIAMGLKTEVRVHSLLYLKASVEVAEALQIEPGVTVQKAVRVRRHRGRPFSLLTTFVPEEIGRTYDRTELMAQPLLLLLERAGVTVDQAKQTISARLATPEVAQLLEMEPGDALLYIRRVVYDDRGRPVEYVQGLYRPDTYEPQMSFERRSNSQARLWESK